MENNIRRLQDVLFVLVVAEFHADDLNFWKGPEQSYMPLVYHINFG